MNSGPLAPYSHIVARKEVGNFTYIHAGCGKSLQSLVTPSSLEFSLPVRGRVRVYDAGCVFDL